MRLGWGKSNFSAPSPRRFPFQPLCQISGSFIRAELHGRALLLCIAPTSTTSHLIAQHPQSCSRSHPSRAGHEAQTSTPSPSACPPRCRSAQKTLEHFANTWVHSMEQESKQPGHSPAFSKQQGCQGFCKEPPARSFLSFLPKARMYLFIFPPKDQVHHG